MGPCMWVARSSEHQVVRCTHKIVLLAPTTPCSCASCCRRSRSLQEHGSGCADFAAKIELDFSWVAVEKAGFGTGDYDFSKHDIRKSKTEYQKVCVSGKVCGFHGASWGDGEKPAATHLQAMLRCEHRTPPPIMLPCSTLPPLQAEAKAADLKGRVNSKVGGCSCGPEPCHPLALPLATSPSPFMCP